MTEPPSAPLEARVARLEALDDIRALQMAYVRFCDGGFPPDRIEELFTPECVWDGGELLGRHAGHAELRTHFADVATRLEWSLHYIVSGDIDVADDLGSARSTWYLWQPLTINGTAAWHMGRYREQHELTAAGWRISELVLTVDSFTPFDRGWVAQRFMPLG
ncbi:nuclear transport factor 2 family protein [Amycolatopsis thermoflava]|uniref:nuclear transport factor 2 family protein n=1 Tax=Amycolatopsis thermoflava TaxID=84480 RepID=UPI003F4A3A51